MISGWLIFGIIMIYLLICVAISLLRGLARARFRAVTVGISAIAAVVTTLLAKQSIIGEGDVLSLLSSSMDAGEIAELLQNSPSLVAVIHGCITSLCAPLLCVAFFIVYSLFFEIVYLVFAIIFRKGMKEHNKKCRLQLLRAAGIGVLQGLVGVYIFMIPLTAYLHFGAVAGPELVKTEVFGEETPEEVSLLFEDCERLENSFGFKVFRVLGVDGISHSMTSFRVNDEKICLSDEVGVLASCVGNITKLSQVEMTQYTAKEAETFDALADTFDQSVLLPTVMGEFMFHATDKWMQGQAFLGMEAPTFGENDLFDPFMDELLSILHTDSSSISALKADVHTVADLVSIFASNGVFASMGSNDTEQLMTTLSANGVVSSLVTALGNNPSMKRLVPQITNLGIRAIGQTLGIPENATEIYDEFMNDVVSALNEIRTEEGTVQVEKLTERLETAFDEAGVAVDAEILDFYAAGMVEDLIADNPNEVTEADVQAFFAMYADYVSESDSVPSVSGSTFGTISGSTALSSQDRFAGTVYAGKTEEELKETAVARLAAMCVLISALEDNEDFATDARAIVEAAFGSIAEENEELFDYLLEAVPKKPISSDSVSNTAGMQSSDEMNTQKITMDQLLIDAKEAAERINSENIQSEADAISAIFSSASDLTDMDMENLDLTAVAEQIGGILDSLSTTEAFGEEKTSNLFTAVFQSEVVRNSIDLDMDTATKMAQKANEGNGNYTDTLVSVSKSVDVIQSLNNEKDLSEEELEELIRTITPQSAGMLEVYATPERLESMGTPEQYSEKSSLLLVSMFSYMGREDLENYDAEAKALNQILNLVLAAKSDDTHDRFFSTEGQDDGRLPSEKETVSVLMSSHATTFAVVDVLTDGTAVTDFDPFGLSEKIDAEEEEARLVAAFRDYYASNSDADLLTMQAMAALFGVHVDF